MRVIQRTIFSSGGAYVRAKTRCQSEVMDRLRSPCRLVDILHQPDNTVTHLP